MTIQIISRSNSVLYFDCYEQKHMESKHYRQKGFESNKPTHIGSVSGAFTQR
jgi:hypothetical protein